MIACESRGNSPAAPNSICSKVGRHTVDPTRKEPSTHSLREDITPANGALWNKFLGGLAFGDEASKPIHDDLAVQAFDHLSAFNPDLLQPMASGLADLIFAAPRQRVADLEGWIERLWEIVSEQPEEPLDLSTDIYEKAINSAVGKLTQTLLIEIDVKRSEGGAPTTAQLEHIRKISNHEGTVGQLGRAVLGT